MPYNVGGVVEPVGFTVALDDWAKSVRRIAGVLGEEPPVVDYTADDRKRARYFGGPGAVAYLDLVEAEHEVRAGDCEIVFRTADVEARVAALDALGIPVSRDPENGWSRVAAKHANGVAVAFTDERPVVPGAGRAPVLTPLPYVYDWAVESLEQAIPIWNAILGVEGVNTPRTTDSGGQFDMHHYLVDGETHAVGLMQLRADRGYTKRDSQGHCQEHILATHGEGLLCVGFLYKGLTSLTEHIERLSDEARSALLFESPRSYLMGENNITHPDTTGGVEIVVARHYEGWTGDLNVFAE